MPLSFSYFQLPSEVYILPCDTVAKRPLPRGTADTLDGVLHRTRIEFLPETASPCYFAHRDGGHYYITNTTEKLSRQVKFNLICPINYNKRLWKMETIGSRI